jgi:hypothetical protein
MDLNILYFIFRIVFKYQSFLYAIAFVYIICTYLYFTQKSTYLFFVIYSLCYLYYANIRNIFSSESIIIFLKINNISIINIKIYLLILLFGIDSLFQSLLLAFKYRPLPIALVIFNLIILFMFFTYYAITEMIRRNKRI